MYDRAPRVTFMSTVGVSTSVGPGTYDVCRHQSKTSGRGQLQVVRLSLDVLWVKNFNAPLEKYTCFFFYLIKRNLGENVESTVV